MTDKALSVQQPWAWLIVNDHKPVENRGRHTSHRGPLLIHASKTFDSAGYIWVKATFPEIKMPFYNGYVNEFPMGGIVGQVEIVGSVTHTLSKWFSGPIGYVMRKARQIPLIPCKGKLGIFRVDQDVEKACSEALHG